MSDIIIDKYVLCANEMRKNLWWDLKNVGVDENADVILSIISVSVLLELRPKGELPKKRNHCLSVSALAEIWFQ